MGNTNEDRIVYDDGQQGYRTIRGIIVREDEAFFYLQRRDGITQIARRAVIKIERRTGGD